MKCRKFDFENEGQDENKARLDLGHLITTVWIYTGHFFSSNTRNLKNTIKCRRFDQENRDKGQEVDKKAQHRSWHTAKCNKLNHLKWNIHAWDTAMPLHGRHFVRHLGICNPICIKLLQLMTGVITHNSVKKRSLYINKRLSYSQL